MEARFEEEIQRPSDMTAGTAAFKFFMDKVDVLEERIKSLDNWAGDFVEKKEFYAYYVMPRFGRNLEDLLAECNEQFSTDTIL